MPDRPSQWPDPASAPVNQLTDMTALQMLEEGQYDCMIELTPLNIFTGQPATDHIRTALSRGKHAITANKGPIAWHYRQLKELAEENNARFYYETVVMDAGITPEQVQRKGIEDITMEDIQAAIDSTTSIVSITTDLMKTISIVEHEPEIEQTAYGIFGDLLRVIS